ncbi:helix-turn-helix transcriptional regulator [uncultured Ruegeria sp.]|uniref:helix-turn-helix transcriptional regulator n=1 Tax=uncultured Ruegeria sp. TaxID=259304 RepID=UPI002614FD3B|nr:helix-turn-helix transcriptional regulator [uncultured Ruegeria sp.]
MSAVFEEVGNAIRTIGSDDFYPTLQALIEEAFDIDNFLVLGYQGEGKPSILFRRSQSAAVHAELESRYVPTLYVLDPFYSVHLEKYPSGSYRLRDISPDRFKTTNYFLEYYQKTTLLDEIAFIAYVKNGWTINVCVGRDETSGSLFGKGSLRQAKELAPCIGSLLERHFSTSELPPEEGFPSLDAILIERLEIHHEISITLRQAQVAVLLLRGHSSKSIAEELGVSWQTVRVFRRQLYARCNVSSQAELFALLTPLVNQ